jgi:hypothetical protein
MGRFLCLGLALFSSASLAAWTEVGKANEVFAAYADPDSIRSEGQTARMSGLYDFKRQDFTPEGRGLFSTVVLREYDCAARRVRLLSYVDFSGHMATGAAVATHNGPRRWEAVLPGALDEAFLVLACRGKGP